MNHSNIYKDVISSNQIDNDNDSPISSSSLINEDDYNKINEVPNTTGPVRQEFDLAMHHLKHINIKDNNLEKSKKLDDEITLLTLSLEAFKGEDTEELTLEYNIILLTDVIKCIVNDNIRTVNHN